MAVSIPALRWWPWNEPEAVASTARLFDDLRDKYTSGDPAYRRALGLLLSMLTQEQQASYLTRGYFEVRGSHGGLWRIWKGGRSGNAELAGMNGWQSYCAAPQGKMPDPDIHLGQMLAIVTNEASFLRAANRMGLGPSHYSMPDVFVLNQAVW